MRDEVDTDRIHDTGAHEVADLRHRSRRATDDSRRTVVRSLVGSAPLRALSVDVLDENLDLLTDPLGSTLRPELVDEPGQPVDTTADGRAAPCRGSVAASVPSSSE